MQQNHSDRPEGRSHAGCAHPRRRFEPLYSARDYVTGDRFLVGHCYECGLYVTAPVPTEDEISRYYPGSYYGSGQRFNRVIEWLLDRLYSYRAAQIERNREPGKVLDIGCGRGLLLNKLRQQGWEPHGTELSEEAAAFAREEMGLPVTTQRLEDAHFADQEFDLVILWHVLEHARAPREMLKQAARILKPGGTLLVAVPNFGSWEARWSGPAWFHLDVPRHLTHWSFDTLSEALEAEGMSVRSTSYLSVEYDFFSFVQTVQSKMGLRHNLLYNLLRTRSARMLGKDRDSRAVDLGQAALALATAVPLGLMSLLYVPIVAALKKGATMAIYAVKEA
jgi:methionine biosynthesis protein MetW